LQARKNLEDLDKSLEKETTQGDPYWDLHGHHFASIFLLWCKMDDVFLVDSSLIWTYHL
jgi:hypothetical protein